MYKTIDVTEAKNGRTVMLKNIGFVKTMTQNKLFFTMEQRSAINTSKYRKDYSLD